MTEFRISLNGNSVVHSPSSVFRDPVRERIHLLQLLILNEYVVPYVVARYYLGVVDVDE